MNNEQSAQHLEVIRSWGNDIQEYLKKYGTPSQVSAEPVKEMFPKERHFPEVVDNTKEVSAEVKDERGEGWVSVEGKTLAEVFEEFGELKDNWDGYGGIPPSEQIIMTAKRLASMLVNSPIEVVDIMPNSHGTISIDWMFEGRKRSLEIGNNNFSYVPLPAPPKEAEQKL